MEHRGLVPRVTGYPDGCPYPSKPPTARCPAASRAEGEFCASRSLTGGTHRCLRLRFRVETTRHRRQGAESGPPDLRTRPSLRPAAPPSWPLPAHCQAYGEPVDLCGPPIQGAGPLPNLGQGRPRVSAKPMRGPRQTRSEHPRLRSVGTAEPRPACSGSWGRRPITARSTRAIGRRDMGRASSMCPPSFRRRTRRPRPTIAPIAPSRRPVSRKVHDPRSANSWRDHQRRRAGCRYDWTVWPRGRRCQIGSDSTVGYRLQGRAMTAGCAPRSVHNPSDQAPASRAIPGQGFPSDESSLAITTAAEPGPRREERVPDQRQGRGVRRSDRQHTPIIDATGATPSLARR